MANRQRDGSPIKYNIATRHFYLKNKTPEELEKMKEQQREYIREYREKYKEENGETYKQAYYKKHKEEIALRRRKEDLIKNVNRIDEERKKQKLKEIRKETQRRYREKHNINVNEKMKQWKKEYEEKYGISYDKVYYMKHRDKVYAQQTRYRHKNAKRISQMVIANKKKRANELIAQGVKNPWGVINSHEEPRYYSLKRGRPRKNKQEDKGDNNE